MRHASDGYSYMMELGYDEVARICMTHSFNNKKVEDYVGDNDTSAEELALIQTQLAAIEFDEYDKLIQFCDALAAATGVVDIEQRMLDVKRRYGFYTQSKWDSNISLRKHFEEKCGRNIYEVVEKDTYTPQAS